MQSEKEIYRTSIVWINKTNTVRNATVPYSATIFFIFAFDASTVLMVMKWEENRENRCDKSQEINEVMQQNCTRFKAM